jgi:hypothetical protein
MDLDVHRAIQLLALTRAATRLGKEGLITETFHPMWLGNWLTDMNQASAFFDVAEGGYKDPYSVWDKHKYNGAKIITDNPTEWTNMFKALWEHEWHTIVTWKEFQGFPKDVTAVPAGVDDIGGYYPYDHFDVVDRADKSGESLDKWEFEGSKKPGMTRTACDGVFTQCLYRQLNPVFSQTKGRAQPENLRLIGYATHTLQDFFAHSNFIELLLEVFSKERRLDADLSKALVSERTGTYAAYAENEDPGKTPVMTGRFDRIDTVASLLRIYERNLVAIWGDLDAGGFHGKHGETGELMLEVLFGTFTQEPFRRVGLEAAKGVLRIQQFIQNVGDAVVKGAVKFVAGVVEFFSPSGVTDTIDEAKKLLLVTDSKEAKDYAKAGRIMYLLHNIEEMLREQLTKGWKPQLPHHTLLTKDHDESQPEVRLAFKLACSFAVDVTTDILCEYFRGGDLDAVNGILSQVYQHPREFLKNDRFTERLNEAVIQLYGKRWWQWADNNDNGLAPVR